MRLESFLLLRDLPLHEDVFAEEDLSGLEDTLRRQLAEEELFRETVHLLRGQEDDGSGHFDCL